MFQSPPYGSRVPWEHGNQRLLFPVYALACESPVSAIPFSLGPSKLPATMAEIRRWPNGSGPRSVMFVPVILTVYRYVETRLGGVNFPATAKLGHDESLEQAEEDSGLHLDKHASLGCLGCAFQSMDRKP